MDLIDFPYGNSGEKSVVDNDLVLRPGSGSRKIVDFEESGGIYFNIDIPEMFFQVKFTTERRKRM